ncbi:PR domain zinc finger protein 8b isoform X2 [Callorhinchus milii]|uniref:PR domain zinc finger protein 8 n=1 Tax=Callorhinchus milii TaxID=7868 RepID=A0A4W3HHN3_CALMI|nr:PR domain zinc finger protein 8b isoform X2 [Callorhinchus milii]|eukprot:gi/632958647/ref/XP_007895159.1/ PREDICTED: PR domain zinc finger protein 8 isoform X2 [Callorhinchus milii]
MDGQGWDMDDSSIHKGIWESDASKAVQQCLTDIFTSVYTTCDIPEHAIFGPCILSHTSLYDSIAFIALKSTDKRTVPYIFRVDTSAANSNSEGLMWLRLVQSARDKEEQNLEAYVKNGQLLYRSLRRIDKDEELLVWYGKELSELLLLSNIRAQAKMNGASPYTCLDCSQRFQCEYPFLAHLRFRCQKRPSCCASDENVKSGGGRDHLVAVGPGPKFSRAERHSQENKPTTDFHNLARDMEHLHEQPRDGREAESVSLSGGGGGSRRKYDQAEGRNDAATLRPPKTVDRSLTTIRENLVRSPQQFRGGYFNLRENGRSMSSSSPDTTESKSSAFVEVKRTSLNLKQTPKDHVSDLTGKNDMAPNTSSSEKTVGIKSILTETQVHSCLDNIAMRSAFTSVSQVCGTEERKSAFSQPSRSLAQLSPLMVSQKVIPGLDCHSGIGDSGRLYQADALAAKLQQSSDVNGNCTMQSGLAKQSPFVYATAFWPKASGPIQLQVPSALTLLPPSFTSFCLPAQNWCAKCNASFRMTSDLVYHMRSHHKKEYAMEPLVKRRREEKLKCPICNESFRERHHLSRHMTSHN